jgi:uncharacterized membrane protein
MKNRFVSMLLADLLLALSIDLLYLYFVGAWYDPIQAIEYTEVVLLFVIAVFGLAYAGMTIRKLFKGGTQQNAALPAEEKRETLQRDTP